MTLKSDLFSVISASRSVCDLHDVEQKSISQSVSQSVSQPVSQSVSQSFSQLINQVVRIFTCN